MSWNYSNNVSKNLEVHDINEKYKNKYRIDSTRLKNWDYSWNGHYFITICTKDRQTFFGNIENGIMILNDIGKIAEKFWLEIPEHFDNVILDEFVIMPDHVHGILIIDNQSADTRQDKSDTTADTRQSTPVDTRQCLVSNISDKKISDNNQTRHCLVSDKNNETQNNDVINIAKKRFQNQGKKTISAMIGSYKSICTKTINKTQNEIFFAWQSRFYDRIIRNETELNNVRKYIIENPMKKWEKLLKINESELV